jgi:hypothetical protein
LFTMFSLYNNARVAKLADARDLKSRVPKGTYRFNSDPGHHSRKHVPSATWDFDRGSEIPR